MKDCLILKQQLTNDRRSFNLLMAINLLYVALVLLWDPLQRAFLNIDGAGRFVVLLTFLVVALNVSCDRRFLTRYALSSPVVFWGLWVVYSTFNQVVEGYYGDISFFMYVMHHLVKPFVVMVLTIKETRRDYIRVTKLLTLVFLVYALISSVFLAESYQRFEGRTLGELGNLGPLNTLYILFFSSLLFIRRRMSLKVILALAIIVFVIIISSVTRKAFAGAAIIIAFLVLSQLKLTLPRVAAFALVMIALLGGLNYSLDKTLLGQRFEQGIEVGKDRNTTGIKMLNFLGDRATSYEMGWSLLKDNMINGIGLKNYYYKGHGSFVLHSEYLVQLVEGGIIGTLLFVFFHFWIVKRLWRMCISKSSREVGLILSGGYLATLFIGLTAWTYQFPFYFAVLGVIIGYIKIHLSVGSATRSSHG